MDSNSFLNTDFVRQSTPKGHSHTSTSKDYNPALAAKGFALASTLLAKDAAIHSARQVRDTEADKILRDRIKQERDRARSKIDRKNCIESVLERSEIPKGSFFSSVDVEAIQNAARLAAEAATSAAITKVNELTEIVHKLQQNQPQVGLNPPNYASDTVERISPRFRVKLTNDEMLPSRNFSVGMNLRTQHPPNLHTQHSKTIPNNTTQKHLGNVHMDSPFRHQSLYHKHNHNLHSPRKQPFNPKHLSIENFSTPSQQRIEIDINRPYDASTHFLNYQDEEQQQHYYYNDDYNNDGNTAFYDGDEAGNYNFSHGSSRPFENTQYYLQKFFTQNADLGEDAENYHLNNDCKQYTDQDDMYEGESGFFQDNLNDTMFVGGLKSEHSHVKINNQNSYHRENMKPTPKRTCSLHNRFNSPHHHHDCNFIPRSPTRGAAAQRALQRRRDEQHLMASAVEGRLENVYTPPSAWSETGSNFNAVTARNFTSTSMNPAMRNTLKPTHRGRTVDTKLKKLLPGWTSLEDSVAGIRENFRSNNLLDDMSNMKPLSSSISASLQKGGGYKVEYEAEDGLRIRVSSPSRKRTLHQVDKSLPIKQNNNSHTGVAKQNSFFKSRMI